MASTAIVTGGSRGIGRATVQRLLAGGWSVLFTCRSASEESRSLEAEGQGRAIAMEADVRDASISGHVVATALARFGSIDALVNNAGVRNDALMFHMTDEQWRDVLETNLSGPWAMCRAVLPEMLRQKRGSIVNVASLSGLHGVAGQTNYSAAKGGLMAMTRSLAREVARSSIRVNCVAPGLVETDMIANLDPEARKAIVREIPMRRVALPGEVAATIAFFLSDDASAITGQVLAVDCGTSA